MIRVKVLSRLAPREWARYFPGPETEWGNCRFTFGHDDTDYDWLVVYHDLPQKAGERFPVNHEVLACPRANTLLVTHEPPNVKVYGNHFTGQFGHVLTSQPEWALPHAGRVFSQPALNWYYGRSPGQLRNWQQLAGARPQKSRQVATVSALKQHRTREHVRRDRFVSRLRSELPGLDIFGRGVRPVTDKSETIDDYRYHIAVENYIGLHHWTEKLADPLLGLSLPLYSGCPNVAGYFPEDSLIMLNLDDMDEAVDTVRKVIHDNEYERRLPALLEARRLLLEKYNFFAVTSAIITDRHAGGPVTGDILYSRRAALRRSPAAAARYLLQKAGVKARLWRGG